ncbi:MAG: hypothetical protein AAFX99_04230, partial [Myxococcota bacterium]
LALPLLGSAVWSTLQATRQLDPHQPVRCCQAIYTAAASPSEADAMSSLPPTVLMAALACTLGLVAVLGLAAARARSPSLPLHGALLAAVGLGLPVAAIVLTQTLAAYHYGVLHHHCPWCLFLSEHHSVGYPIFGALTVLTLEALAAATAAHAGQHHSMLVAPARARIRRAHLRMAFAWLLFGSLAFGPAIAWRLQYGVWMHG